MSPELATGSLVEVLAGVAEPAIPRDGDCIEYSELVTSTLNDADIPANRVTVLGWIDHGGRAILFGHYATQVGDTVVDFTARQYHPQLPARWIAPVEEYCTQLAELSGASCVTIGWG